jgi:hypothetical protein
VAPADQVATPGLPALAERVIGVLRAPRATFAALAEAPRWADVLALTCAVTFLCSAALLGTEVGRLALLDQWERTAIAFGQQVDDARYLALEDASRNGTFYAAVSALLAGPLLVVGLSALLIGVFNGLLGGSARFRQVLAVVAHAGVILALRQVIATPLNYARETLASPTTMTSFVTVLDEASPPARFFGIIDLFVVWWAVAVALGVAVLYRRPARRLVVAFVGAYVALAGLLALVMALTGGTA